MSNETDSFVVQTVSGPVDKSAVDRIGGWKQLSTQTVYENPWIQVSHQDVQRPNGTTGIYGLVHFKGRAIGIVPVDEQGNTWLVKQSRYTLGEYTWEIPEGGASRDEDPIDAAKRELEEETGMQAECWEKILTLHTSNSVTDELAYIYLATDMRVGVQKLDDTEDIEVKKLPLSEAVNMAKSGGITDAMSVAALLMVEANLAS